MGDAVKNLDEQVRDAKEEIRGVEQKIEGVEKHIERIEEHIERVEEQFRTCSDLQERARLQKKEKQLREEKLQFQKKEEQLREEKKQLREEKKQLQQLQHGRAPGDQALDYSEVLIRHMLPPAAPGLPRNKSDVTRILFPEQGGKLPVSKGVYNRIRGRMHELAPEFLIEADDSLLCTKVGSWLEEIFERPRTELGTSIFVGSCFLSFFNLFRVYSEYHFPVELIFNATEKSLSHSATTQEGTRPDTMAMASGCTFLVGEDKVCSLAKAESDLFTKMKPLNPMFYGEVNFILGYIAGGCDFQWVYIGKNGGTDIAKIGLRLDLSNTRDRCKFLLSLGYAYRLLKRMADAVPDVPGRRALFSKDESSDKKRTIYFQSDHVLKRVEGFYHSSAAQGTSLDEISKAYQVAQGCPFLPKVLKEPTVTKVGIYNVSCGPVGYSSVLQFEWECRQMAEHVCRALVVLHEGGLVHRDIRLANIVRLSRDHFMLIDLETVAWSPFEVPQGFNYFVGWTLEMLEGNYYTPLSDLYTLGEILEANLLPMGRTPQAEDFVRKLKLKQLTASQALEHEWFSES